MAVGATLWMAHAAVAAVWGTRPPGPLLSDTIQFTLGAALVYSILLASRRSEGLARSFWQLTMAAYVVWLVAQGLSVYNHFAASDSLAWTGNLLFSFWFVPMAMTLFLDPEREPGRVYIVMALDFVQGVLVCVAAYLYFFYLPRSEFPYEMAHEVWAPYFVGYGAVVVAFLFRGFTIHKRDARALFRRFGIFLALSAVIDALYDYGPGHGLAIGSWFDLLWTALLLAPMVLACTWKQAESPELPLEIPQRSKPIYTELSYLLFPVLVLFMSMHIARARLALAGVVVLTSFVCSNARLLITQHRLVKVRETLRREAAHDGLTGLWNRKAIFEILDRELQRAERADASLGLIMIDVDHFKVINDTRGHAAGDSVLRIIASGIASVLRPYDSVGRYGGEEFLIVAPGCGLTEACELAERVRTHIAGCSINVSGSPVKVSLSLGVATGKAPNEVDKLLHNADAALYQAKNAGRNRVEPTPARAAGASQSAGPAPAGPAPNPDFWL